MVSESLKRHNLNLLPNQAAGTLPDISTDISGGAHRKLPNRAMVCNLCIEALWKFFG